MSRKRIVTALIISLLLVFAGCNQTSNTSTSAQTSSSEQESVYTPDFVPANHIHTKLLGDTLYVYTYVGEDLDKGYGFGVAQTPFSDGKGDPDSLKPKYAHEAWYISTDKKPLFFTIKVENIKFDGEESETPKIVTAACYGWFENNELNRENLFVQQFLSDEYPQYTKVTFVEQDEQEYHLGDPILIGFVTEPDVDVAPDSTAVEDGLGLYFILSNFND